VHCYHGFKPCSSSLLNANSCIKDQYYTADGGEDIRRDVEAGGEPYIPHVETLVNKGKPISVFEYWQLNKLKMKAQKSYLDKWNAARGPISGRPVDVLLTPTMPHTAVLHRNTKFVFLFLTSVALSQSTRLLKNSNLT
jgi:hypothetical protein